MWNTNYAPDKRQYGLLFTLLIAVLPIIILHFLNMVHYFMRRGEVPSNFLHITTLLKAIIFITHMISCVFLYLTIPWTKRVRFWRTILNLPKNSKEVRDSIIAKDPFQKDIKYRFYQYGKAASLKGCRVWRIIRPPRAAHCYRWGYWVQTYDHHCIWLSCCIGQGNYTYFWGFLISLNMVYLLVIFLNSLVIISENGHSRENERNNIAFSVYSVLYIFLWIPVLCFIFPLLWFHTYLIMTDQTTYEYYKSQDQVWIWHHFLDQRYFKQSEP